MQLLGEAEDNIRYLEQSRGRVKARDGKTLEEWRAVVRDLWEENPGLDQEKIRDAVGRFRSIYDDLFQQMSRSGTYVVNVDEYNAALPAGEEKLAKAWNARGMSAFSLGNTPGEMAARLYGLLREAERRADVLIAVEPAGDGGVMTGVKNRLKKACASEDIPH